MITSRKYAKKIVELTKGKDLYSAFDLLKEAVALYPSDRFLLSQEIYLLYRLGRYKEAHRAASERRWHLRDNHYFLKTYLSILDHEMAISEIDDVLEEDILGQASSEETLYISAAKVARRHLSSARALAVLAYGLQLIPNSQAIKSLYEDVSSDSGPNPAQHKTKGKAYYEEKYKGIKRADVIAELEDIRCLPSSQKDVTLDRYLAELYKKQKNWSRAIQIYREAVLRHPDDQLTAKLLGIAYYRAGDFENALPYIKNALKRWTEDHVLRKILFFVYERNHDYEGLDRAVAEILAGHQGPSSLYGVLKRAKKLWKQD